MATAYGMGESERILGTLARLYERKDVETSVPIQGAGVPFPVHCFPDGKRD